MTNDLFSPSENLSIDLNQIEVTADGFLCYQGQLLIVYAKDTRKKLGAVQKNPKLAGKFHFASCSVIGDVRNAQNYEPYKQKRYERYVATRRMDGLFCVTGVTDEENEAEVEVPLQVCRSCLAKLNYQNYNSSDKAIQNQIAETFNIQTLFAVKQPSAATATIDHSSEMTAISPMEPQSIASQPIPVENLTEKAIPLAPSVHSEREISAAPRTIDIPVSASRPQKNALVIYQAKSSTIVTHLYTLYEVLRRLVINFKSFIKQ